MTDKTDMADMADTTDKTDKTDNTTETDRHRQTHGHTDMETYRQRQRRRQRCVYANVWPIEILRAPPPELNLAPTVHGCGRTSSNPSTPGQTTATRGASTWAPPPLGPPPPFCKRSATALAPCAERHVFGHWSHGDALLGARGGSVASTPRALKPGRTAATRMPNKRTDKHTHAIALHEVGLASAPPHRRRRSTVAILKRPEPGAPPLWHPPC